MRLDWEIAKRGWRRYAAYPWATVAGIFTNTVFGFIQAYILLAVYEHRSDVGGYDTRDTLTYVWLAQALIMTVYMFGWQELALRIRDGSIATDLSRPLDPQRYWLAYDIGRAPYHFIFRGVLPFVFGALVFQLHYPTVPDALAFVVSVVLAVVVSLGFRFLYNSSAFWFVDVRGVMMVSLTVSLFFSGMVMPLALLPGLAAHAGARASVRRDHADADRHLAREASRRSPVRRPRAQAFWALFFLGLGRLTLNAGRQKLVVQGG